MRAFGGEARLFITERVLSPGGVTLRRPSPTGSLRSLAAECGSGQSAPSSEIMANVFFGSLFRESVHNVFTCLEGRSSHGTFLLLLLLLLTEGSFMSRSYSFKGSFKGEMF